MVATAQTNRQRRDESLERLCQQRRINLEQLDEGQKWVVFAGLQVMAVLGGIEPLRRLVGYVLAHCGMQLGSTVIGAVIGVSDRAVRYLQGYSAEQLLDSIKQSKRGHRAAKLGPEQAGPLAKYLFEHPGAKVAEIVEFVAKEFGVRVDRLTLRRYLARYGLGCFKGQTHQDAPLLSAPPNGVEHFF